MSSPTHPHLHPLRGFTLIELMVVLLIMGMAAALLAPRFGSALTGLEIKGASRDLASALRYARGRAIASGSPSAVLIDVNTREYWVADRPRAYRLPSSVALNLLAGHREWQGEGRAAIRFYPDGSASGGQIRLAPAGQSAQGDSGHHYQIDVHWLTGRVRVSAN
ncbi:GspH/FimT family pseudopilin [Thiorhodospira sibirica]|uniref:GspH/FimT family pseudopilin n=1 Tax=Thiorhodospira sibirica TaxID=154347 RepID=UPI00022C4C5B|nr:GspH/FimT family pseudopilin [Thiorhodospira sibirica]